MIEIGYTNISLVLESWDMARFGSKDFEEEFGMTVLHKMFELQPRAKKVFGYDKSEEQGQKHAEIHGKAFGKLLDSIFQMLGPDTEFIEEILTQVGKRHKVMGVNPSFFPFLGQALIFALETKYLEKPLTDDQREAWEEVFEAISNDITKAILAWARCCQTKIRMRKDQLLLYITFSFEWILSMFYWRTSLPNWLDTIFPTKISCCLW